MKNKSFIFGGVALVGIVLLLVGLFNLFGKEVVEVKSDEVSGSVEETQEVIEPENNATSGGGHGGSVEVVQEPEVELAPDFSLKTPSGETISLSQYRGDKPVILDFWASWCHNCQRDMPKLSKFYEKYGNDVEVIGVNLQEKVTVAKGYVDRAGIKFPIVMDPAGVASRAYGVRYTNYHVLINKDGSVSKLVPGDISENDIVELINSNS